MLLCEHYTSVINLSEISKTAYMYDSLQDCAPAVSFFQFSWLEYLFTHGAAQPVLSINRKIIFWTFSERKNNFFLLLSEWQLW